MLIFQKNIRAKNAKIDVTVNLREVLNLNHNLSTKSFQKTVEDQKEKAASNA